MALKLYQKKLMMSLANVIANEIFLRNTRRLMFYLLTIRRTKKAKTG